MNQPSGPKKPSSVPSINVEKVPTQNLMMNDVIFVPEDFEVNHLDSEQRLPKEARVTMKKGDYFKVVKVNSSEDYADSKIIYQLQKVRNWQGKNSFLGNLFGEHVYLSRQHLDKILLVKTK